MSNEIERGFAAQKLLETPAFKEALDGLDQHYTAAWRAARTVEAREDCYRYVTLLEKLVTDIQTVATTGTLHQARKNELEGKRGILQWQR